jgi:hypothetical protein
MGILPSSSHCRANLTSLIASARPRARVHAHPHQKIATSKKSHQRPSVS